MQCGECKTRIEMAFALEEQPMAEAPGKVRFQPRDLVLIHQAVAAGA